MAVRESRYIEGCILNLFLDTLKISLSALTLLDAGKGECDGFFLYPGLAVLISFSEGDFLFTNPQPSC